MENNDYWLKKDMRQEFNILTAQALNLAVELFGENRIGSEERQELKDATYMFIEMLLEIREDEKIRNKFLTFYQKREEVKKDSVENPKTNEDIY